MTFNQGEILPILQRPQRPPSAQRNTDEHPLFRPVKEVQQFDAPLHKLIQDMKTTMRAAQGIGLAAPQVGISQAIFIIEATDLKSHPRYQGLNQYAEILTPVPYQVFINPRITSASEERTIFWHACLSGSHLPRGKVATHNWLEYEAYDLNGSLFKGRLERMAAIIFQHEFCHLLGMMYYDQARDFLESSFLFEASRNGKIDLFATCTDDTPLLIRGYQLGETLTAYAQRQ